MTSRQPIGNAFTSATCANLPDMRERARNRRFENPGPPSTSIEKALAVLSALNGPLHSRGISDLAKEVGLPRPTLHRILKQLANWGFVDQLPSNRYQVGLRLFELGTLVYHRMRLRTAAMTHLHSLYHQTECTVYLTVSAGNEVLHLDCLPAKTKKPIPARAGGRWSMHCSSVGKVLLAHAPQEQIDEYVSGPLRPMTKYSIRDPDRLLEHLEHVRSVGYGETIEESIIGIYGVAAGIRSSKNDVVAAVCIAGSDRNLLDAHDEVIRTADAISRELTSDNVHSHRT
jgi:DNA-binding IclR family transcriptional regulator